MRALVTYHSEYGHAEEIARTVAAGIRGAGGDVEVALVRAADVDAKALPQADLWVAGGPVHMGGVAWPLRRLLDATSELWMRDAMEGRLGAAFVTFGGLGGAGGGAELALLSIWAVFAELGMLPVPFPKSASEFRDAGLHWGLAVRTGDGSGAPRPVDEAQRAAARAFGAHLGETLLRLRGRAGDA